MTHDDQANDKPKRELAQPTMSELEDIVDKWIGVRAITTNSPELIESVVDTRREEALRDFQAYTDRAVTLGRIDEVNLFNTDEALEMPDEYIVNRRNQLKANLTISVRDGGETSSQRGKT